MGRGNEWLGGRDSNPDSQIQSLVSYHWTTSQQRTRIYVSRPANVNRVVSRIAGRIFIAANTGYSLLSSLQSCAYSSRVVPPRRSTGNIKLSFVGKTKLDTLNPEACSSAPLFLGACLDEEDHLRPTSPHRCHQVRGLVESQACDLPLLSRRHRTAHPCPRRFQSPASEPPETCGASGCSRTAIPSNKSGRLPDCA